MSYRPAHSYLSRDDLRRRVEEAVASLADCRACPRDCGVNRLEGKWAACKTGRHAIVGSHFPHFGEEDCLRGWNGSGTIFFTHCNLRCQFCFHPQTPVVTDRGVVRIRELFDQATETDREEIRLAEAGTRVLTREGRWAQVAKAFRHQFEGELIRLKAFNCPPLLLTPNHRVFAVSADDPDTPFKVPAGNLTGMHRLVALNGRRGRSADTHPVRSVQRIPYSGPVYNLEVDDPDHSYVASSLAVANCQNYDISQGVRPGPAAQGSTAEEIAAMMLSLQERGCHNINFVTPEHVVPQVVEAIAAAVERGLTLPIVYNTSAYDALHSLELMDGLVDVYMPDFKFWSPERSRTYMKAEDYPEAARAAVLEMQRQVGDLVLGANGLAKRGLIVRHLVMPGMLDETRGILEWVATALGPDTYVNLMDQYYPAGNVDAEHLPEIDRKLRPGEFAEARRIADDLGLRRLDERDPHPLLRRRLRVLR